MTASTEMQESSHVMPFKDRAVLITGGTKGLGRALGIEFSRYGGKVIVTHRWGSVGQEELIEAYSKANASQPTVLESDVSDPQAMRLMMETIKTHVGELAVVISNVAFAKTVVTLEQFKKSSFEISMSYSAWPVVELLKTAHDVFGHYPKYVLGVSSDGTEICHDGYALAGTAKAAMETLCRYLALMLKPHGVRINAVRPGFFDSDSARATFGSERFSDLKKQMPDLFLDPTSIAKACVGLCSGLMDAVTGQVVVVDNGCSLVSPLSYLIEKSSLHE